MSLVSISPSLLDGVGRFGYLTDRGQPFSYGKALPIAIILGLLVFTIDDFANHPVRIWVRDSGSRTAGEVCPQFSSAVWMTAFWAGAQNLCAGWGFLACAHAAGTFGEQDVIWNAADIEEPDQVRCAVLERLTPASS